ncbi:hypothetical protein ABT093_07395 [Kitasatospora sp. NPDC002551]|uniref:hypothetical protein n=1 Tax=unclassified Kitasatospora TaxID=2633591 RepID=UPI003328E16B
MATDDERPLADLLDVFWQGSVPAAPGLAGDPEGDREGEAVTAFEELGPSGLAERGRPLDPALAAAYRRFTGAG